MISAYDKADCDRVVDVMRARDSLDQLQPGSDASLFRGSHIPLGLPVGAPSGALAPTASRSPPHMSIVSVERDRVESVVR